MYLYIYIYIYKEGNKLQRKNKRNKFIRNKKGVKYKKTSS